MEQLGRITPTDETRAGRMLSAGRLVATITSKKTGEHVTLRLKACRKDDTPGAAKKWPNASWDEATHVFIGDYDDERIATFYPKTGKLWVQESATQAARWSVIALLRYVAGLFPHLEQMAELAEADLCGRCGLELTDPESLERGLGPTCFGKATGSTAAAVWSA